MFRLFICLFTHLCKPKTTLNYFGGPIIQDVKIITVWWGRHVKYTNELEHFYKNIVKTNWFTTLNEYNITGGNWERSISYNNSNATVINNELIARILLELAGNSTLNYYFAVHLSSEISVITTSGQSCVDFYAYHSEINRIYYGVIPECVNRDLNLNTFDTLTHSSSHELAEAVTNPKLHGWITDTNEEIADLCNTEIFTSSGYVLNSLYSNKSKRCISDMSIYAIVYLTFYVIVMIFFILHIAHLNRCFAYFRRK